MLHDVTLSIAPRSRIAVVGETGSGKSTLAKLLTRLMDPAEGDRPCRRRGPARVRFSSLRDRVVMVPQEGFLFDATLLENVRFGRPDATDEDVELAVTELGLDAWLAGLPHGMATEVGQRGESLSAGERQLVALARAYLADPDLLVLDEATSAVDPATEVRLQRALEGLTRGPHLGCDRAPALDRRGRRRGRRRRPGAHRGARTAPGPRRPGRRVCRPARILGRAAARLSRLVPKPTEA